VRALDIIADEARQGSRQQHAAEEKRGYKYRLGKICPGCGKAIMDRSTSCISCASRAAHAQRRATLSRQQEDDPHPTAIELRLLRATGRLYSKPQNWSRSGKSSAALIV
jgi:hypothetical protein